MADTAVASGLMLHQKDEHDIWICKDCGWKYPNAKPSSKIRKHHKKQCPGKAGADAHAHGGSSDDASDDEHHHHSSRKGDEAASQTALDVPAPPVESESRDFNFASASFKEDLNDVTSGATEPVVNGSPKAAADHKDAALSAVVPVEASKGGLMPHQKDEHDIWICKDCGWKYPNAKPSSKIRKHHKKQCPGKAGADAHAPGGSSDDASDDEHHHHSSRKGDEAANQTALDVPAPPVESKSRDFDFASASVKEDSNAVTSGAAEPVFDGSLKEAADHKDAALPAAVPVEANQGGLMPHQKDEHDIWICKECGWKYPNAKPSPKIRKNHKKHCPEKGGAVAAGGSSDEVSDDEHHLSSPSPAAPAEAPAAAEAELPPAAPVEIPSTVEPETEGPAAVPEVPRSISKEIDFAALKESSKPDLEKETTASRTPGKTPGPPVAEVETRKEAGTEPTRDTGGLMLHQKDEHDVWICKDCGWKYPNAKPSPKIRKNHKKKCPRNSGSGAAVDGGSGDEASDDERHTTTETVTGKDVKETNPAAAVAEESGEVADMQIRSREFSFGSAVPTAADAPAPEAEAAEVASKEKEDPAKVAESKVAPATEVGGLMPHQEDEGDVWVCKECGWRYPNAKPSAKIRKNHKKKCPKKVAAKGGDGGSSDGASSDDNIVSKGGKCFPCL